MAYWGSKRFTFAASSSDEGTIGVTQGGERVALDDGYWRLAASPGGSYLAGYNFMLPCCQIDIAPGLRIFDGDGLPLESIDDASVSCVDWNAAPTILAYQLENSLYLWDAASGSTRLVTDQLSQEECPFQWVHDIPE